MTNVGRNALQQKSPATNSTREITTIYGAVVGRGTGALVMGHPFNALAWLANSRAQHGLDALRAGEIVLLGSLVEPKWLSAGARVRVEIEKLGALELTVDR